MTVYAVVRKSDGVECYRYSADAPIEWSGFEFANFNHVAQDVPIEPPPPPAVTRITKFAFRARFTHTEKVTIELASLDNPSAPFEQRSLAAALRAGQQDIAVAAFVDLNLADTRLGVLRLEAVGLIGAGRALEILDTPPTEDEVWNG